MTPSGTRQAVDINAVISGMVDRGAWLYYDNLITAAGTALQASYTLFSVPLGNPDPITSITKTKINTNMTVSKQFSPPRCLVMMSMGFLFQNMLLADIQTFLLNYYVQFFIDDKIFFEGLIPFYPPGMGLSGSSQNSGESNWNNGLVAPQYTRRWGRYSKYIAPLQQFTAQLTCGYSTPPTLATTDAGGAGLNLIWELDGITDRSVQ